MCQICDVERGNCELLMYYHAEVKVGPRKLDDQLLSVSIQRDEIGNYSLVSSYFIDNDDAVAMVDMPIEFCPFCGKEVQHDDPKQYPWNQEKRA